MNLKLGSTGRAVHAVENRLKDLGYLKGPIDQKFDRRTAAAVMAFKQDNGWDAPKPVVHERMADALNVKTKDGFDKGTKTPSKMNGGSYNCEIGRNPAVVAKTVADMARHNKLDFIQLQEISGYDKQLEKIPGYKLITFPGSKDHGETGVLVRDDIEAKFPKSIEAETGWTNTDGKPAQPRAATSVRIAGWLRVVSVHAPPGIDWKNGHAVGADARVKSYKSLTQKLLAHANRQERRNPDVAMLIGGDWNEGASTGGPGSPSWLAAQAGMKKHANHSIDWEMSRGVKVTGMRKGGEGGSDHRLVLFTVSR